MRRRLSRAARAGNFFDRLTRVPLRYLGRYTAGRPDRSPLGKPRIDLGSRKNWSSWREINRSRKDLGLNPTTNGSPMGTKYLGDLDCAPKLTLGTCGHLHHYGSSRNRAKQKVATERGKKISGNGGIFRLAVQPPRRAL
jgi:hypothetical protein